MKKIVSLVLALGMTAGVVGMTAGCGSEEGEALVVWAFTDELGTMIEDYYKANVDADANIDVKVIGVNDLDTKLTSAWRAKKNLPDIVAIEEKYIAKYAASDMFLSLYFTSSVSLL